MRQFFRSFINAVSGVWQCVLIGRNLRIQITAASYVLMLSPFFLHSRMEYAIVLIAVSLVLSLEIINTSIERLCDQTSPSYTPLIRFVKDAAAGGVLVSAFFSVFVFFALYIRWDRIQLFLSYGARHLWYPIALVALVVPFWIFIFWGPGALAKKLRERKQRNK